MKRFSPKCCKVLWLFCLPLLHFIS